MQLPKPFIAFAILALVIVGAFGMAFPGMTMGHGDMGMIGCPLATHGLVVCSMNPLEHLNMWQSMFAAIPVQTLGVALTLLLAAVVLLRFKDFLWRLEPSPQPIHASRYLQAKAYNPLQRFVARGLMHPKVF